MLREVSSQELSEWAAYFSLKNKMQEQETKAAEAKRRAKQNNY